MNYDIIAPASKPRLQVKPRPLPYYLASMQQRLAAATCLMPEKKEKVKLTHVVGN
jgi:hypothetical protein